MSLGVAVKALILWFGISVLAIANGLLRENALIPSFGPVLGMLLSGALLSCLILTVAYFSLPWLGTRAPAQLLLIGIGWLSLTLIFEFVFGLSRGKELAELLDAYTFRGGNIWVVVLLTTVVSPWLAARIRGWI